MFRAHRAHHQERQIVSIQPMAEEYIFQTDEEINHISIFKTR